MPNAMCQQVTTLRARNQQAADPYHHEAHAIAVELVDRHGGNHFTQATVDDVSLPAREKGKQRKEGVSSYHHTFTARQTVAPKRPFQKKRTTRPQQTTRQQRTTRPQQTTTPILGHAYGLVLDVVLGESQDANGGGAQHLRLRTNRHRETARRGLECGGGVRWPQASNTRGRANAESNLSQPPHFGNLIALMPTYTDGRSMRTFSSDRAP